MTYTLNVSKNDDILVNFLLVTKRAVDLNNMYEIVIYDYIMEMKTTASNISYKFIVRENDATLLI